MISFESAAHGLKQTEKQWTNNTNNNIKFFYFLGPRRGQALRGSNTMLNFRKGNLYILLIKYNTTYTQEYFFKMGKLSWTHNLLV